MDDFQKIYESGVLSGSSKERVRILEIIEEFVKDAGNRAIMLTENASLPIDKSAGNELLALAKIAEYEQQAYLKVMKEINKDADL